DNMDDLLSLKGVGRKTANLVMVRGFDKFGICVDTHVHRITNRWGFVETHTPFETEMELRRNLSKKNWKEINSILVTF
ncbi:MAG: endonuclease III domain-containing protein, partial [Promethearchaeota archaeon]